MVVINCTTRHSCGSLRYVLVRPQPAGGVSDDSCGFNNRFLPAGYKYAIRRLATHSEWENTTAQMVERRTRLLLLVGLLIVVIVTTVTLGVYLGTSDGEGEQSTRPGNMTVDGEDGEGRRTKRREPWEINQSECRRVTDFFFYLSSCSSTCHRVLLPVTVFFYLSSCRYVYLHIEVVRTLSCWWKQRW